MPNNTFWLGAWIICGWPFFNESMIDSDIILECEFGPNLTPKAGSLGEGCSLFIYSILPLSLVDVGLGFSPILRKCWFQ